MAYVLVLVNNIPKFYRSCDLRDFFSQFLESDGFVCFHFKHRPETKILKSPTLNGQNPTYEPSEAKTFSKKSESTPGDKDQNSSSRHTTTCCVVKVLDERVSEFLSMYNKRYWLDKNGDSINSLCHVTRFSVSSNEGEENLYKTRREQQTIPDDRIKFTRTDLQALPELNPPYNVMPKGNVGTPTRVFLDLINACKLPPKIIENLGLKFPKFRSNRRYGTVPLDYGTYLDERGFSDDDNDPQVCSGTGVALEKESSSGPHQSSVKPTEADKDGPPDIEIVPAKEDGCDVEEWERHEALHDDPSNVERNKEILYEDVIELQWEKGGPGLVFYTDAQYWKEQEGDFDEQTADDWDVDMSGYYEENGGDMDARDYISMRRITRLRDGKDSGSMESEGFIRKRKHGVKEDPKIGLFEKYTKGVGRKVMEKQGWTDGGSLGSSISGPAEAIDPDGQKPSDKRGLGYYGEKVNRYVTNKPSTSAQVRISTIYDHPPKMDPPSELLRRNDHNAVTHRYDVPFVKARQDDCEPTTDVT